MKSQILFLNIFKSCLHTAMALGPQRSNSFAVSLAKMDLVPGKVLSSDVNDFYFRCQAEFFYIFNHRLRTAASRNQRRVEGWKGRRGEDEKNYKIQATNYKQPWRAR